MKSFAMTLNLKNDPELIAQYVEYHANTWPEVLDGLKGLGISSMKIFQEPVPSAKEGEWWAQMRQVFSLF